MQKILKRGQIQSQTLIYVLTLVVVALVLIFGYQAIKSFNEKGNQVILLQFENQLRRDVDSLSSDYGSVKVKEYTLPSGFNEICFIDLENIKYEDIVNHPIMLDSVKSGVKKNMFLFGENSFQTFYIENLKLANFPYYSCIQLKTKTAELKIEGLGNAAVIKTPPNQKYCQNAQNGGLCNELDKVLYSGYKSECCKEYGLCC